MNVSQYETTVGCYSNEKEEWYCIDNKCLKEQVVCWGGNVRKHFLNIG